MDEEISVIDTRSRNEKIKNFIINNKKKIAICLTVLVISILGYFIYQQYADKNKVKLADKYNSTTTDFLSGNKLNVENELVNIINTKDTTYSPLALYFLIDNNITIPKEEMVYLFDRVIVYTALPKEIRNLILFKKAIYFSESESENSLLSILKPVINSDSIWKSHALYFLGEYFLSKNEKQKAKDFFEKILITDKANPNIKLEAKKRIERDLSE